MKRICFYLLIMIILLSGCSQKDRIDIETFGDESIATVSKSSQDALTETLPENTDLSESTEPIQGIVPSETPRPVISTPSVEDTPMVQPVTSATATKRVYATATKWVYPTQTQGSYPIEPGKTKQATATSVTSTPSVTNTPPATATEPSASPTATSFPFEWEGEWHIWFQNSKGLYIQSIMTLQRSDQTITGNATIDGVEHRFEGIINEQDHVVGDYYKNEWTIPFYWEPISDSQFTGSWAARFGFCGNKVEARQPEDCRNTGIR